MAARAWRARALALGLAATALGLARFGYTVLLPAMRADLGWSYTQAGGMNTANAFGYLVGALAAAPVITAVGERRAFAGSFALTAGSVLASGLTGNYPFLLTLRGAAGAGGGVLFVAGGTLAARLATTTTSPGLVLGIYYAGVAPGILLSALLTPKVLGTPDGWRVGWIIMGAAAAVAALPAVWAARSVPAVEARQRRETGDVGQLGWSLAAFTLFGLGYVSYMTFIVAYYRDAGRSATEITAFWSLLALASAFSAWAWRSLLERSAGGRGLAILLGVVAVGAAATLASDSAAAMLASAILFGGGFLSVSAAMTQLVRRSVPSAQWALGLALATTLFAGGQVVGPVVTGLLADRFGGLRPGLLASTALLGAAVAAATLQGRTATVQPP